MNTYKKLMKVAVFVGDRQRGPGGDRGVDGITRIL
jgi:hypothetical protein